MEGFFSYFIVSTLCLWAVKTIKYQRMRFFKFLSLSDINAGVILAALMGASGMMPLSLRVVGACLFLLTFVLLYLDAVAFQVYSAEIEPSSIKLFLKNYHTMKQETSAVEYLKKEKNFIFVPAVAVFFVGFALGASSIYLTAVYISCMVLLVSKTRVNPVNVLLFIGVAVALLIAQEHLLTTVGITMEIPFSGPVLGGVLFAALCAEYLRNSRSYLFQHSFMTQSSAIFGVIGLNSLRFDDSVVPTDEEKKNIIDISYPERQSTAMTNAFSGSNVILISLESVGMEHMAYYQGRGAVTPVFDELAKKAYVSRRHCCISPNTHTSLHTMLNGDYFQHDVFPYITSLKQHGYRTFLLTPQNFLVETKKLLTKNAYDHYYTPDYYAGDGEGAQAGWGGDDYAIFERGAEDVINSCRDGRKFFLHITNNQTHINYTVFDKDRFGRFNDGSAKHRYLNAVEESDYLMGRLLGRLEEAGLMDDTLIVYTSDHGQAFGGLGYRAHSTAISAEEMNVPFLIHHPRFNSTQWIEASNHFDLFPTLLDLTGVPCHQKTLGYSLFSEAYSDKFMGFSSTRKGRGPSNFGMIHDGRKVMIDLVLRRFWRMSPDDREIETLTPKEQKHLLKLMHDALQERGLIY